MGTASVFSGGGRPIGLLFSESYTLPEDILLNEVYHVTTEGNLQDICLNMIDYMLMDSTITIEDACRIVLRDRSGHDPLSRELSLKLTQTKSVDVYIRMCNRDRVARTILEHGIDITVIGGGWDKFDLFAYPNFSLDLFYVF